MLFSLGIEEQVLPQEFLSTIPKTSSHEWRKKDHQFYGSEFEEISQNTLTDLKLIADERLKSQRRIFVSLCRLYLVIVQIFGEVKLKKLIKQNHKILLPYIDRCLQNDKSKKIFLKLLKISSYQLGQWRNMKKYECKESLIWLCYKRLPRQISMIEIMKMKQLLKNDKYSHWSSISIWGKAVKEGQISMSLQSWYRYSQIFGLGKRKKYISKRKRTSVNASFPNEIWHMDVTRYKTLENVTLYIYTVLDNYSRKILAFDISRKLSGKIRLESLKNAIQEQFLDKLELQNKANLDLIVDGGSENNNINIHEFIKSCKVEISKKIALKDVVFSNSIIEGNNRILKQTYLNRKLLSEEELLEYVPKIIDEYNCEKPHYAHKIYTPDEIYKKPELKNYKYVFDKINKVRIENNKNFECNKVCI